MERGRWWPISTNKVLMKLAQSNPVSTEFGTYLYLTVSLLWTPVGLQKILSLLESEDPNVRMHAVKVVANLAAEGQYSFLFKTSYHISLYLFPSISRIILSPPEFPWPNRLVMVKLTNVEFDVEQLCWTLIINWVNLDRIFNVLYNNIESVFNKLETKF